MNIFQHLLDDFEIATQEGCVDSRDWHLSFVRPFEWTQPEKMNFHREVISVDVQDVKYEVTLEYAVLTIDRPWMNTYIFKLPFSHNYFNKGKISDGAGKGFFPAVNTGIIVTRYIKINNEYENSNYQIIGWIVENLPLCPRS